MPISEKGIPAQRVVLVARAEDYADTREPPLRLGDIVRLNSGGPACLVVDLAASHQITVSYRVQNGRIAELTVPAACINRVRDLL